jgi:hypothetical protein
MVLDMRNLWVCLLLIGCGGSPSTLSGDDTPGDDVDGGITVDASNDAQMLDASPDASVCTADTQTDPNNCGACGRSCLGGTCSSGVCSVQRLDDGSATGFGDFYADALFAYYTGFSGTTNPHRLWRVPLSSGSASYLGVIVNPTPMSQVSFDGTDFYVVEPNRIDTVDRGNVRKIGKEPFSETTIINFLEPTTTATFLYNGFVYWATDTDGSNGGDIKKMPMAGGQVSTVTVGAGFVQYMETDGTNVYWTGGGQVKKAPMTGGAPVVIGSSVAKNLSTDGTSVFGINSDGWLISIPVGGGTPTTLSEANITTSVSSDDSHVYASQLGSKLVAVPKAGGDLVVMWSSAPVDLGGGCFSRAKISHVKVIGDYVYFSVPFVNSCGNVTISEALFRAPRM